MAMTDYLFARPTFLAGVARVFDLGCQFDSYNVSADPEEADARAIFLDWFAVGKDIARAGIALSRQVDP
jgi:hypothetical protein